MKFAAIHEYRGERAIRMMCRVLGVSRGGHYDWVDRPDSARARRHRTLTEKIRQVHHASPETSGAPRIRNQP